MMRGKARQGEAKYILVSPVGILWVFPGYTCNERENLTFIKMQISLRMRAAVVLLAMMPLSGCLFRTREVQTKLSTAALKDATLPQLIENINNNAQRFQTLNAQVNIDSSVGGEKKGKITDNPEITGYLLVRKPDMLRMIGKVPVVRNTAFDMVSDGRAFRLSIPPKNKFLVGSNQISKPSPNPLENIRPQHILDALLLKEIEPVNDIAVLEDGVEIVKDPRSHKDVEQATYVVIVLSKDSRGYYLARKIVFNRERLEPERQLIYDRLGHLVTDARYSNFNTYNGMRFPTRIDIDRPVEEYAITLNMQKVTLNEPIRDEQFALTQPPGSQLIDLDQKATAQTSSSPPGNRKSPQ